MRAIARGSLVKQDGNKRERKKQAQEGNSRVRLEMTNKRAKTCQNVKNVEKCWKMLKNVKKC